MFPDLHPQWQSLDFVRLLALPSAFLIIDPTNSLLSEGGAQTKTGLWQRANVPDGPVDKTRKLVLSLRSHGTRIVWLRYEYLRDHYPATPMDEAQYRYRYGNRTWTTEQKLWDAALVEPLKQLQAPDDIEIVYQSFGNIFLGTPLQQILTTLGIRTLLLAGYHLDECVEQAARTSRDLGFMPVVIADCCLCDDPRHEAPTLDRISACWAPIVSTEQIIGTGGILCGGVAAPMQRSSQA